MAAFQNQPWESDFEDSWRTLEVLAAELILKLHEGLVDEKVVRVTLVPLLKEASDNAMALLYHDAFSADCGGSLLKSCASTDCISDTSMLHHSDSFPLLGSYAETMERKFDFGRTLWPDSRTLLKREEELERVYRYRLKELDLRSKELNDAFESVAKFKETLKLRSELPQESCSETEIEGERELVLAKFAYEVEKEVQEVTAQELETMKELLALKYSKPEMVGSPKPSLIASSIDTWCSALLSNSKPKIAQTYAFYKWTLRASRKFHLRQPKKSRTKHPLWLERIWLNYRADLLLTSKEATELFNRSTKAIFCKRLKFVLQSALKTMSASMNSAMKDVFQIWRRPKMSTQIRRKKRHPLRRLIERKALETAYEKKISFQHWRLWGCNLELYLCRLELFEAEQVLNEQATCSESMRSSYTQQLIKR
mmetsp:Transcript_13227/g.24774  ORF Transcript_13227/g.24774 Transcript_13227/m.24774 type:complete len:425 (-) Transcript_13227:21-1295(-)